MWLYVLGACRSDGNYGDRGVPVRQYAHDGADPHRRWRPVRSDAGGRARIRRHFRAARDAGGVALRGRPFLDTVAGLSGWVVAVVGGIALAALRADARRQRGVIVWHLPAGLILVVLPYAVFVGLFYVALTCSS